MAYCSKCGQQLPEGSKFCPSCGSPVGKCTKKSQADNVIEKIASLNDTEDSTSEYDEADISTNRIIALFSYLGPLVLVPIIGTPKSKFAMFHANQGLILLIAEIVYANVNGIIRCLLKVIFPVKDLFWFFIPVRGTVCNIIYLLMGIVWLVFVIASVIGIINAARGKAKELPVIGGIRLLK